MGEASLLQGLQYKGKIPDWDLIKFLKQFPISPNGNPYDGFVGSPLLKTLDLLCYLSCAFSKMGKSIWRCTRYVRSFFR